jgi:hypothetical protein
MKSIQLKTHIGSDGILQVQMPPEVKNVELEVLVVFQPTPSTSTRSSWRDQLTIARDKHGEKVFSDSVELLREDRNS